MSVTDVLYREHDAVLSALEAFESALNAGDWTGVEAALRFFDEKLVLHRRKEEEALFPALGERIGSAGPIACMLHEHQDERGKIEDVRAALASGRSEASLRRIRESGGYIVSLLRAHIGKENQILFPIAEQNLTEAQKAALGPAFEAIGTFAPAARAGAHPR